MSDQSFSGSLAQFGQRFVPRSGIRVRHPVDRGIAGDNLSEIYCAELNDEHGVQVVSVQQLPQGIEPERADRLAKRMAQILSIWVNLSHPNIVPLIGFYASTDDPGGMLISPWMTRGSLHDYVRDKELDMEIRIQLCCDTALGVAYLHSLSPPICHGNLTSGNILVNDHGRAMISNFAFAERLLSDHMGRFTEEGIAGIEGNIRWMSPERILEQVSPTEKGDVWAFGCVCYEILTSKIPYSQFRHQNGTLILNIMQGRLPGEFDSVSLPGKVASLLSSCWSIRPEERPTMATVAATLLKPLDEHQIHTLGRLQDSVVKIRGARANIERGLVVSNDGVTTIVAVKTYQENLVRVVNAQAPKCWGVLSNEAGQWQRLKHDNIVPVWGFVHQPSPALVYPWYGNGDLGSYLLSNPQVRILEKLVLLRQVAHGLAYLHQQSPAIIHRHLNISHVLLSSSGDAAILGCHLPLENTVSGDDETAPFLFPEPHAPEIIMNECATTATDVFGFGALMLQVLTGKTLHYDVSTHTRTAKILEGRMLDRTLYPGLPEQHPLWSMIQSCLAVDSSERPTISEVSSKLNSELDQHESPTKNTGGTLSLLEPSEPVEGRDQNSTPGSQDVDGEISGDLVLDEKALVSAGGFADVYKGTLTASNGELVTVAVKILRTKKSADAFDLGLSLNDAVKVMEREVLIWKSVKHEFIAPFLGFQIKDKPCLVSLWYENGDLATFLSSHPGFRAEEKLRLVYETALALGYLHHSSPPICHADIKPTNVLVSDSIHAQLTDFGLSKLLHESESSFLTHTQPIGTKGYQAPELLFGSAPSFESDIFAFGSFIIAAMSGLPPFHDLNAAQTVFAFTRNVLPSPQDHPGLSPKLWELVKECFNLEPLERPNISQVVSVLANEISDGSSRLLIQGNPP